MGRGVTEGAEALRRRSQLDATGGREGVGRRERAEQMDRGQRTTGSGERGGLSGEATLRAEAAVEPPLPLVRSTGQWAMARGACCGLRGPPWLSTPLPIGARG